MTSQSTTPNAVVNVTSSFATLWTTSYADKWDNTSASTVADATTALRFSEPATVVIVLLVIALVIVTVVGNSIVILAFVIDKNLRKLSNFLILNLALNDVVVGAICIPFYLPYFVYENWVLGRVTCVFWLVIDYVIPAASAWNILLISLDRYLSVRFTLQYMAKQTSRLTLYFMLTPWVIGFLVYAPAIVLWEYWSGVRHAKPSECFVEFSSNLGYLLFGSVVEFIFPFVAILVLNVLIYLDIKRRTEKRRRQNAQTITTTNLQHNGGELHSDESVTCQPNKRLERDRRFAKSIAIIILVFGCCWAPYEFMALVSSICPDCIPTPMFETGFWLFWVNSTLNPLLYPFTHSQFRSAFDKLLCRRTRVGQL